MKDIWFRGKRIDNGEWIYSCDIIRNHEWKDRFYLQDGYSCNQKPRTEDFIEVDPETVGQYIGLKDKKDKEICVGDIYKWYQPLVKGGKQVYRQHLTAVVDEIVELFYLNNRSEGCHKGVEVIGNIYEHPELLEKAK